MANIITLFGIVYGDMPKRAFSVKVAKDVTIGELRELIKTKKRAFTDIDADALSLWRVNINFKMYAELEPDFDISFYGDELQDPSRKVSEVFGDTLDETRIRIIVQVDLSPPVSSIMFSISRI